MSVDENAVVLNDTREYPVGTSTRVLLEVMYGDAGQGGTSVIWNGGVLDVAQGEPLAIEAGGAPLANGIANCSSNVMAAAQTVHTSVTYRLSGGPAPVEFPFRQDASAPGGLTSYFVNFFFV